MTVAELIEKLSKVPLHSIVKVWYESDELPVVFDVNAVNSGTDVHDVVWLEV